MLTSILIVKESITYVNLPKNFCNQFLKIIVVNLKVNNI